MLFNSFSYAIFLPIVFILYWLLPHKYRWLLLFIASYYFYMSWNIKYVVLILFTTFVSYLSAILVEKQDTKKKKKFILTVTALLCLGVLFFFKYFNFVSESIASVLSLFSIKLHPLTLKLLLPVGISFYTFQTLSYVIDVYRGDIKAEKHFGYYATFIAFFPQLVAGPIERTSNLLPQIKAKHEFDYNKATYGLKLMAWGFFKKMVIADGLSTYVSAIYDAPFKFKGFSLLLATLFFAIQIYCDFSGYSDIAIGSAKLLGIDLMTNFKSPYFSQSIKEFWSRWHISLSTWFKDYIYIPLGGNRVSKLRCSFNLIVTFLASGLWHGANWTYVIWGGIHGLGQAIENLLLPKGKLKSKGFIKFIRIVLVFIFVSFTWIFFVSNTLADANYVLTNWYKGIGFLSSYISNGFVDMGLGGTNFLFLIPSLLLLGVYDYFSINNDVISCVSNKSLIVRWIIYVLFIVWLIISLPYSNLNEFIYFQF